MVRDSNPDTPLAKPVSGVSLRGQALAISGKLPGKHWHRRFIQRHPSLVLGKASGLDPKQAKNFNKTVVADYFEKRKKLNDKYNGIPPEQDWNMDEKGLQMGGGRKNNGRKFIFSRATKNRYRIRSDNLELVTVMECISAAGDAVPPSFVLMVVCPMFVIFQMGQWASAYFFAFACLFSLMNVFRIMTSPSGWTDRELCEAWFLHVFIPFAVPRRVSVDKPIVLTLDGHDSHETPAMKRAAYENDVVVYCFPSKTTHKLQPLDVLVFLAVQRAWSSRCERRLVEGVTIDRYNIIHEYLEIRGVITPNLIKKSFEKTGIYPFNPDIFTDEDCAPSIASSTIAHLPPSYLAEIPSSPPAVATDDDKGSDDDNLDLDYEPGDFLLDSCKSDSDDILMSPDLRESSDEDEEDYEMQDNETIPLTPASTFDHDETLPASLTLTTSSAIRAPDSPLNTPAYSTRSHSRSLSITTLAERTATPHATLSQKPDWQKNFSELISELNSL